MGRLAPNVGHSFELWSRFVSFLSPCEEQRQQHRFHFSPSPEYVAVYNTI